MVVKDNAFYDTGSKNGDFAGTIATLEQACQEGHLPQAPNAIFMIMDLKNAGFRDDQINAVIEPGGFSAFQIKPSAG